MSNGVAGNRRFSPCSGLQSRRFPGPLRGCRRSFNLRSPGRTAASDPGIAVRPQTAGPRGLEPASAPGWGSHFFRFVRRNLRAAGGRRRRMLSAPLLAPAGTHGHGVFPAMSHRNRYAGPPPNRGQLLLFRSALLSVFPFCPKSTGIYAPLGHRAQPSTKNGAGKTSRLPGICRASPGP